MCACAYKSIQRALYARGERCVFVSFLEFLVNKIPTQGNGTAGEQKQIHELSVSLKESP